MEFRHWDLAQLVGWWVVSGPCILPRRGGRFAPTKVIRDDGLNPRKQKFPTRSVVHQLNGALCALQDWRNHEDVARSLTLGLKRAKGQFHHCLDILSQHRDGKGQIGSKGVPIEATHRAIQIGLC